MDGIKPKLRFLRFVYIPGNMYSFLRFLYILYQDEKRNNNIYAALKVLMRFRIKSE